MSSGQSSVFSGTAHATAVAAIWQWTVPSAVWNLVPAKGPEPFPVYIRASSSPIESSADIKSCFICDSDDGLDAVSSSRSEEHTSELQSRGHLVCRLMLEKKKKTTLQAETR